MQTIPGIPPVLVSGNNARPIIEVTNSIWRSSALLFLLLTVVGIWMSQFKMVSEKTGGPGQYLARCLTVGVSLAAYKAIFAAIMWTGALIAFQIFPIQPNPTRNTVIPWLPAGTISTTPGTSPSPTPGNTNSNSNTNTTGGTTRPPFQITPRTSVLDMIGWGLKNAYQITFQALPSMLVIALCNILFVLSIFLITAFWLTFAVILYALGPIMIMAGLIPTYGDKLWGNWIGATIQCSLWQVWMAFCGKLITSSFFIQIEQLNPMNRVDGNSGGGELSTAVMDLQQASYALVFLILYIATPFVANYVFPLGASAGLGAFMLTTATAAATKAVRAGAAIKSGGTSEIAAQGAKEGTKQAGSAAMSGAKNTATKESGKDLYGYGSSAENKTGSGNSESKNNRNGNSVSVVQSTSSSTENNISYDGSQRDLSQQTSGSEKAVADGNTETKPTTTATGNGSSAPGTDNYAQSDTSSSYRQNNSENGGGNASYRKSGEQMNRNEYSSGSNGAADASNNYGSGMTGGNDSNDATILNESVKPEDVQSSSGNTPKTVYVASSERPKDVNFGKLPEPKTGGSKTTSVKRMDSTAQNESE